MYVYALDVYMYVYTEIHRICYIYSNDLSCVLDFGRPRTSSDELARTPMPIGGKESGEEAQKMDAQSNAVEILSHMSVYILYIYIYIYNPIYAI